MSYGVRVSSGGILWRYKMLKEGLSKQAPHLHELYSGLKKGKMPLSPPGPQRPQRQNISFLNIAHRFDRFHISGGGRYFLIWTTSSQLIDYNSDIFYVFQITLSPSEDLKKKKKNPVPRLLPPMNLKLGFKTFCGSRKGFPWAALVAALASDCSVWTLFDLSEAPQTRHHRPGLWLTPQTGSSCLKASKKKGSCHSLCPSNGPQHRLFITSSCWKWWRNLTAFLFLYLCFFLRD